MNKERILALADVIEAQPHTDGDSPSGFNLDTATHACGTPSCIGGFACALGLSLNLDESLLNHLSDWSELSVGAQWLELTGESWRRGVSMELFAPSTISTSNWINVTPLDAAITLRKLAETGKVDWSHCEYYQESTK